MPALVELSAAQLGQVVEMAPTDPVGAIATAWSYIIPGWELLAAGSVKPHDWAIPMWQWEAIGQALSRFRSVKVPGVGGVEALLEWVNIGPAAVTTADGPTRARTVA
jgi:hypothetical protein